MNQYGTASVYGVDGAIQYNGASAIAAFPESVEGEQRCQIDEFMSGIGDLIGFKKNDSREYLDLTLVPKRTATGTGDIDAALGALAYPSIPSKITFTPTSGVADSTTNTLYGTTTSLDYIYVGGARRTQVRGQAALRITCFKPVGGSMTVAQLLVAAV